MSSTTIESSSAETSDEIIQDKQSLQIKHQVMGKMKWSAMFSSISESCKFVAGPLFGIGATLLISALTVATNAALLPIGVGLIAGALAVLSVAIGTGYYANRIWQSGTFDNFEINAQSTARHLVQELKTGHTVMSEEHTQNVRGDGKTWVQATNKGQFPQLQPQGT